MHSCSSTEVFVRKKKVELSGSLCGIRGSLIGSSASTQVLYLSVILRYLYYCIYISCHYFLMANVLRFFYVLLLSISPHLLPFYLQVILQMQIQKI